MRALGMVMLLLLSVAADPGGAGKPLSIGFSIDFFHGINQGDAMAAMKVWSEGLGRNRGTKIDAEAKVYADQAELSAALSVGEVDLVIVLSKEMVALRKQGLVDPKFVSVRGGSPFEEYLLLVRRGSGIEQVGGLEQKKILIQNNARASLAAEWIESLLRENGMALESSPAAVNYAPKASKVVLPVFFGNADACVVTRNSFKTLCEFNPQMAQQLTAVAESPPFVPTSVCFRTGYESDIRADLLTSLAELHTEPRGQQVLMFFKVDKLGTYKPELMENVEKLLNKQPSPTGGPALAERDQ